MADAQRRPDVPAVSSGCEVPGSERVTGANRLDHVDRQRGFDDSGLPAHVCDGGPPTVLDHDLGRLGEQCPDGLMIVRSPQLAGFVEPDEHDIGTPGEVHEDRPSNVGLPQGVTVVHIERHGSRARVGEQVLDELAAGIGQGRQNARDVHVTDVDQRPVGQPVDDAGGGAAPKVVDRGSLFARLLEVQPGGQRLIQREGRDVDAFPAQGVPQPASEWVVTDAASEAYRHAKAGQMDRNVQFGATLGDGERVRRLERTANLRSERNQRLAHAQHDAPRPDAHQTCSPRFSAASAAATACRARPCPHGWIRSSRITL